jgi:hypothetical protein
LWIRGGVLDAVQAVHRGLVEVAVVEQPAQTPLARLRLDGAHVLVVEFQGGVENGLAIGPRVEHAVGDQH